MEDFTTPVAEGPSLRLRPVTPLSDLRRPKSRDGARPIAVWSEKTLERTASSGDLSVKRQATWGMPVKSGL